MASSSAAAAAAAASSQDSDTDMQQPHTPPPATPTHPVLSLKRPKLLVPTSPRPARRSLLGAAGFRDVDLREALSPLTPPFALESVLRTALGQCKDLAVLLGSSSAGGGGGGPSLTPLTPASPSEAVRQLQASLERAARCARQAMAEPSSRPLSPPPSLDQIAKQEEFAVLRPEAATALPQGRVRAALERLQHELGVQSPYDVTLQRHTQVTSALSQLGLSRRLSFGPGIHEALASAGSWGWNVFALQQTHGNPLAALLPYVLARTHLDSAFSIPASVVAAFAQRFPVHPVGTLSSFDPVRAASNLHRCLYLVSMRHVAQQVTALQFFAVLLASMVAPPAHPAASAAVQLDEASPLRVLYNDVDVLEQAHLAALFTVLASPEADLLASLSPADRSKLRTLVIKLVLGASPRQHCMLRAKLVDAALAHDEERAVFRLGHPDDAELLLSSLLRTVHLADACRPREEMLQWMQRARVGPVEQLVYIERLVRPFISTWKETLRHPERLLVCVEALDANTGALVDLATASPVGPGDDAGDVEMASGAEPSAASGEQRKRTSDLSVADLELAERLKLQ